MQCLDCDAPSVKSGRCADCLEEVTETPCWQGTPVLGPLEGSH